MTNIVHLTSAHPRYDTRIFHKMCRSLESQGHSVSLVVADGRNDEILHGIHIYDVGAPLSRLDRIIRVTSLVFYKAVSIIADIYHLHDPELLPIALRLKRLGKCVVFDSHEDVPLQMLGKTYLNKTLRYGISYVIRPYESWVCRQLDGVIAATPSISEKFIHINKNTVNINNYPMLDELYVGSKWANKKSQICYIGCIADIRGAVELVDAMGRLTSDARLVLAGSLDDPVLLSRLQCYSGWQRVSYLGFLDRLDVRSVLADSVAGIVAFHALPNHVNAQPNKMFEYMSAAIPVIASDFPLWREIIGGNECGLLVDPLSSTGLARAIDYLFSHPSEAEHMGCNGRRAVECQYNWSIEANKLFAFYFRLLHNQLH